MFDQNTITRDVINRVGSQYRRFKQELYRNENGESPDAPFQSSPLLEKVSLLVQVANGEVDRTTAEDQTIGDIVDALQDTIDLLFSRANGHYAYTIPPSFWSQPGIGQVLARVQAWLRRDDLISYTEAAQILFKDLAGQNIQAARMRIKRLVERGELMSYIALDETNPTQQVRISRQAVEALLAAGRTP